MFTPHGHHIPGTIDTEKPAEVLLCGGIVRCPDCKIEAELFALLYSPREFGKINAMNLTRIVIGNYYLSRDESIPDYDLAIVDFDFWEFDGRWRAVVSPACTPETEYQVRFFPHIGKYVVYGGALMPHGTFFDADGIR